MNSVSNKSLIWYASHFRFNNFLFVLILSFSYTFVPTDVIDSEEQVDLLLDHLYAVTGGTLVNVFYFTNVLGDAVKTQRKLNLVEVLCIILVIKDCCVYYCKLLLILLHLDLEWFIVCNRRFDFDPYRHFCLLLKIYFNFILYVVSILGWSFYGFFLVDPGRQCSSWWCADSAACIRVDHVDICGLEGCQ